MNTDNQASAILERLRSGPLTSLEALKEFGCFRLAARIAELRAQGHQIDAKIVKVVNDKRVARYTLRKQA